MSSRLVENVRDKDMVVEITRLHGELRTSYKTDLGKAVRIGELLRQKKAEVGHGEWEKWVRTRLPFAVRTASDYMWIASHRNEYPESATIADLRAAHRSEREQKPKKPATEASPQTEEKPAPGQMDQKSQESTIESKTFKAGVLSLCEKPDGRTSVVLDTDDGELARKFFERAAEGLARMEA